MRRVVYVGWIRAPSEQYRDRLQCCQISGEMRWVQETPAFGVFEHCQADKMTLEILHSMVARGEIDIQIGGFTGIWLGTEIQLPPKDQYFWHSPFCDGSDFAERHGYKWNTTPGVGFQPIRAEIRSKSAKGSPTPLFVTHCPGCNAPRSPTAFRCPYCGIYFEKPPEGVAIVPRPLSAGEMERLKGEWQRLVYAGYDRDLIRDLQRTIGEAFLPAVKRAVGAIDDIL